MVAQNICFLGAFILGFRFCSVDKDPVKPQSATIVQHWATDTVLKTPESVLYEPSTAHIYVSNINAFNPGGADGDGFISKLDKNGKIENLKWATGLNDPKGLATYKGKLYASDLGNLVEIDLATGQILAKYPIPDAVFSNDLTVDKDGVVYISDTGGNVVYQFKDGKVSLFLEKNIVNGPNGLLAENKKLYTFNGDLYETDYNSKTTTKTVAWGIPDADGIKKDKYGNFLLTSYPGEVYYGLKNGEKVKILDTKAEGVAAADIEYIEKDNLLLMPTLFNNRVVAYKVKY